MNFYERWGPVIATEVKRIVAAEERKNMKDYRPLLSDVTTLLEEVIDYQNRELQDDGLDTSFSSEDVQNMLEKINQMFEEIDDAYGS